MSFSRITKFIFALMIVGLILNGQILAAEAAASRPLSKIAPELPAEESVIFNDGSLIDEVISTSQSPKIYDWRNSSWELNLGVDSVDEGTVFSSRGWHIGAGFSLGGGLQIETGLRRLYIRPSKAGNDLEKTPFRQPAQPSRYELYALFGYSLMEGRISSRLSPWLSDFEHVFSVQTGLQYVHPTTTLIPTKEGERSRVSGQSVVVSSWVILAGLRYTIYLPSGLGVFFSSLADVPVSHIEGPAGQWINWNIGAVYAFGAAGTAKK